MDELCNVHSWSLRQDGICHGCTQKKDEELSQYKAMCEELAGQVKMSLAYKLRMNINGLESLEKVLSKYQKLIGGRDD